MRTAFLCFVSVAVLVVFCGVVAAQEQGAAKEEKGVVLKPEPGKPGPGGPVGPGGPMGPGQGPDIRAAFEQAGATQEDQQALGPFMQQRRQLQEEMMQKLLRVREMAVGQDDAMAKTAVGEYRIALQDYLTKRQALDADLCAKLKLENRPRLEALFLVYGILDNGGIGLRLPGMGGPPGPGQGPGQGQFGKPGGPPALPGAPKPPPEQKPE